MGQRKAELIWLCLPPFHLIHPILSSISCLEYMGFIFGGSDGKVEIQYETPNIEKFSCIITRGRLIIKTIREIIDIMFTLFDQDEVWDDYISSDRREHAEKTAKKNAKNLYANNVPVDIIAKSLGYSVQIVEKWLGLVPQA